MLRNILLTTVRSRNLVISVRYKQIKYPKADKKLQAASESLASRGFLRPNKPWEPPANIEEAILKICVNNGLDSESEFLSLDIKFKVLKACYEETGHSVPNSLIHTIDCVDDLQNFYSKPVDTRTPYEALQKLDLPKNLHVQQDYVRFNAETSGMFNGMTAFPKSSTLVTGLKSKKKYESHFVKRSWP